MVYWFFISSEKERLPEAVKCEDIDGSGGCGIYGQRGKWTRDKGVGRFRSIQVTAVNNKQMFQIFYINSLRTYLTWNKFKNIHKANISW